MDFDDSAKDYWRLSQEAALNPQSNAESHEKDSRMSVDSDIVSRYPLLEQSKHVNHSSTVPDVGTTEESSSVTISRLKARQDLHLPPFRSLLVAAPPPNLLLTPPDDTDPFFWKPLTRFSTFHLSKRFPFPRSANMSPREDTSSKKSLVENPASELDAEASTPQHSPSQSSPGFINPQTEDNTPSASNVQACDRYGGSAWVQEAVEVVGK